MKFLTNKKNSPFNKDIWCVVMHPVEYQIPFYEELFKLSKGNSLIIFMDNHSIKPFRIEKWGIDNLLQVRSSNNPLKYKFNYFFSKNFTIFKHKLFVNRINPGIIINLIIYKPKIILITSYTSFTTFLILLIAPFLQTKICLRAEGGLKGRPFLLNRKKVIRRIIDKFINRADYFFYSCKDNKNYFNHRGIERKKMYPLLSSVDTKFFSSKKISEKGQEQYFLIASKFESRKNLIEAILGYKNFISKSKKHFPKLYLAGAGPHLKFLAQYFDKNIIYVGYIQDKFEMRDLLQNSSGLIISSIYDPSPKIINEALACSKPILCRNTIGTSGDLVEHLKNGYIYSPNKKNDLENGISWLVKNNKKKEVKNYCSLKAKEWSPTQNATSLMKLYLSL